MAKAKTSAPRTRRTGEDARTAILDATERQLVAAGPSGIRLQDVAAEAGISHPAVLHHFGSRERLVEAVVKRRVSLMNEEVVRALAAADAGKNTGSDADSSVALFERLYATLGPGGHARLAAFLALEGRVEGAEPNSLRPLADVTHAARLSHHAADAPKPAFEDTYFTVLLSAFALFGEAIVGPMFRGEPEATPNQAVSKRFREWTARLVFDHLTSGTTLHQPTSDAKAPPAPRRAAHKAR